MAFKVTPRFSSKEIIIDLHKIWFEFQAGAMEIGKRTHTYMQNYINTHHKRRGGTGTLARSIDFFPMTAPGMIGWGIGTIANLPPYWYVINYGRMVTGEKFIPARGGFVPGSFEGRRPEPALAGGVEKFNYKDGSNFGMTPKRAVRPMNYIQRTRARLNANLRALINRLKRTK